MIRIKFINKNRSLTKIKLKSDLLNNIYKNKVLLLKNLVQNLTSLIDLSTWTVLEYNHKILDFQY